MDHYAGIDVSLECSSVCVVDASGKIVREGKAVSDPAALSGWFRSLGLSVVRIGLEAGPLSQWLYAAMKEAGLAVELLETRHVRDAFKAMPVKSDRNDARGIAQLMRLGWFRPVHCKSIGAQETRAVLTARKLLQSKLRDVEASLRGTLRGFGLKVGKTTPKRFAGRIKELVADHPSLQAIAEALLAVHAVLLREFNGFERGVRTIRWRPSADPVQKREPGEWMTQKGLTNQGPLQKDGLSVCETHHGLDAWTGPRWVSLRSTHPTSTQPPQFAAPVSGLYFQGFCCDAAWRLPEAQPPPPLILAQVSRRPTVRLNTSCPAVESLSRQK
jgi:Transposase